MQQRNIDGRLVLLFFVLGAAFYIARAMTGAATTPLFNDTDDAMRLVVVRDLLDGQGWYDHIQHRLNTPWGASIHWSRLLDLPLALLLGAFRPLFGADAAIALSYVWPLALLALLLWLSASLARRLAGPGAVLPAVVLPVFSLISMAEFAPGRIDHHAVQILLMLVLVILTIDALTRPRQALWAGLVAASILAIGIEGLPVVAAVILSFGMAWVLVPARRDALWRFGLALGLGSLLHLLIALPPDQWLVPACDALSITYVAACVATGGVFLALGLLPTSRWHPLQRLALGAALGGIILAGLLLSYPECLGGPYWMLDRWMLDNWINRIGEAKPFFVSARSDPTYAVASGVPVLLALIATIWGVRRGTPTQRAGWWVYGGALLVLMLVMLTQVRGARLATSLAIPGAAALIVFVREDYLRRHNPGWLAPLVLSWIGGAGLALVVLTNLVIMQFPAYAATLEDPKAAERALCRLPQAFDAVAALPPTRLMAPIDLGAHLLAFTPHAVVAAPYHRNVTGLRDTFAFFNGPQDEARRMLQRRGITHVVICPAMPEVAGFPDKAEDSFAALRAKGALPDWLTPIGDADATLQVYAVTAGS
ncbi:hypothetical protein [Devosia sp.]|uniref:hypothetical protein n=1 Tax=Devosia sp. TaxID=1871048 RepID=UPI003A93D3BB